MALSFFFVLEWLARLVRLSGWTTGGKPQSRRLQKHGWDQEAAADRQMCHKTQRQPFCTSHLSQPSVSAAPVPCWCNIWCKFVLLARGKVQHLLSVQTGAAGELAGICCFDLQHVECEWDYESTMLEGLGSQLRKRQGKIWRLATKTSQKIASWAGDDPCKTLPLAVDKAKWFLESRQDKQITFSLNEQSCTS